jgi:hypothetical protein
MKTCDYIKKACLFAIVTLIFFASAKANDKFNNQRIYLQGQWQLTYEESSKLPNTIVTLPGTTDTNHKGFSCKDTTETTHLTRLYYYKGKAWYKRTVNIPKSWKGKTITLFLERTKPTTVYVDEVCAGSCNDISTPQIYDLSNMLLPGIHTLTVMVDNAGGVPPQVISSSHAYSEDTQTNWNGIIGQMFLEAQPTKHISDLHITTDVENKFLTVEMKLWGKVRNSDFVNVCIKSRDSLKTLSCIKISLKNKKKDEQEFISVAEKCSIDKPFKLWSEFHPNLYIATAEMKECDGDSTVFGFRSFKAENHHFYINSHETFLRGKHDACVFPLTAHTPLDTATWRNYFTTLKEFGINHVRFHSWCPPEECFKIADEMGFYLQPELPFWGDFNKKDTLLMTFLRKEGENILRRYGNHPSFVMFSLGNELWGSLDEMGNFVKHFRSIDADKLYTFGSNFYLGYKGALPNMDYFTTCRNGGEKYGEYNTHTRGSFSFADAADGGLINHEYPNTKTNFDNAIGNCSIPIISHETGQFQSYPDYNEIKKYTGVLYPYNMQIFRSRLEKTGMGNMADAFHRASGRWVAQLYKADIEMDLRSRNLAGFHLLDLQDYPGQGSAYIGILDAFMKNKVFIENNEWQGFCSPVVPLLITDRLSYLSGDTLKAQIKIANYEETSLKGLTLNWSISTCQDDYFGARDPETLVEGDMTINTDSTGLIDVGQFSTVMNSEYPNRLKLCLAINHNQTNAYDLWVYPKKEISDKDEKGIVMTSELTDEIGKNLQNGACVLLMPDSSKLKNMTVDGLFQTDYWNYRMFKTICENNHKPVSPGTLGLLINPRHPVFMDFPTDSCTSWQWFPITKASYPFILDNAPKGYQPIVQVIDNVERNHKLGLIFEFHVGWGKLLVCMADLRSIKDKYIEAKQLYLSILNYMHSDKFNPQINISFDNLKRLFSSKISTQKIGELKNISFE